MGNPPRNLSKAALERIPLYVRALRRLRDKGEERVSSTQLASTSGFTSDVVRRDMWDLQVNGTRGVGYLVDELLDIFTAKRRGRLAPIAIAGAGNIGSALAGYRNLDRAGMQVTAVFDSDSQKVGLLLDCGVEIEPVEDLVDSVRAKAVEIGVIATPAGAAQSCADQFALAGVQGILNFAPTHLHIAQEISVRQVDLIGELEVLLFLTSLPHNLTNEE